MPSRFAGAIFLLLAALAVSPVAAQPQIAESAIPADAPEAVRKHLIGLYSADAEVRGQSAVALGRMGSQAAPAARFLAALLHDEAMVELRSEGGAPRRSVGRLAAEALAAIGEAALGPLVTALEDSPAAGRASAALVLGDLGDKRAVAPLAGALKDKAPAVRSAAAESLGKLADRAALDGLAAALRQDESETVRWRAAWALGRLGDARAVQPLAAALRDPSQTVGAYAAEALGRIGGPEAVQPLIDAFQSGGHVREAVLQALVRIGEPAVRPLIETFRQLHAPGGGTTAAGAGDLLVQIGRPAVGPLTAALGDPAVPVRYMAACTLGKIKDDVAVEPLAARLTDAEGGVSVEVARALLAIGGKGIDVLCEALRQENPTARAAAALALASGPTREPKVIGPLGIALKDRRISIRTEAARALGMTQNPAAVDLLLGALKDPVAQVRRQAAESLAILRDPRAIDFLVPLLADGKDEVRYAAVLALGWIGGPRAAAAVIPMTTDKSKVVRLEAVQALERIKDPSAASALIARLTDEDWQVRRSAAHALGPLRDPRAVEPLIAALKDENFWVRVDAAMGLHDVADRRAVPALIEALRDKDERTQLCIHAARALAHITGVDYGQDADQWQAWWLKQGGGNPQP